MPNGFLKSGVPYLEMAKGNVPGHSIDFMFGRNPAVGTTKEDVWGIGGLLVYPTAGEQWEVVSSDANDTLGGTGANLVVLTHLDTDFVIQNELVAMNGTTPVTTAATNMFRPKLFVVVNWGSALENVGNITIRVAGGGDDRGFIEAGFNNSLDGFYTVPAGFSVQILWNNPNVARNDGIQFFFRARTISGGGFFTPVIIELFNQSSPINFGAPIAFGEKSDLRMEAVNTTGGTAFGHWVLQLVLIENGF